MKMFSVVDESPIGGFWIHESGGEGSWRVGEHTSRGQGLHINETRKNNIIVASYFLQHCRNYLYSLFNKRRDEGMRGSKRRCVSSNPFLALERCDANPGKSFKVKALIPWKVTQKEKKSSIRVTTTNKANSNRSFRLQQ